MRQILLPLIPVLALGLSAQAFSQNTCSSALDVGNGLGTHAWQYSIFSPSTDSGFNGSGSCGGEFLSIYNDAFFTWTAPNSGNFRFENSFMGGDPELAIYRGDDCAAYCVGYDSDSGPGHTSDLVLQNVSAGQTFLVQVGTWQSGPSLGLTVGFTVSEVSDPCNTPDDQYEDNDDCGTAFPAGEGFIGNLRVTKTDPDLYRFSLAPGATLDADVYFWDTEGDIDIFLFEAGAVGCGDGNLGPWLARGFSTSDNEEVIFTNNSATPLDLVLHVELYAYSQYADCTDYSLWLTGVDSPLGDFEYFCDPMTANSTGLATRIQGSFGSGVGSGLHLVSTQGPPNQFAYFLVGSSPSTSGTNPVGNGYLCLEVGGGNSLGRYNVIGSAWNSLGQFDANGDLVNQVGTSTTGFGFDVPSNMPLPGAPTIQTGSTWHFQLWHREDGGQSNFSNGLSVTF